MLFDGFYVVVAVPAPSQTKGAKSITICSRDAIIQGDSRAHRVYDFATDMKCIEHFVFLELLCDETYSNDFCRRKHFNRKSIENEKLKWIQCTVCSVQCTHTCQDRCAYVLCVWTTIYGYDQNVHFTMTWQRIPIKLQAQSMAHLNSALCVYNALQVHAMNTCVWQCGIHFTDNFQKRVVKLIIIVQMDRMAVHHLVYFICCCCCAAAAAVSIVVAPVHCKIQLNFIHFAITKRGSSFFMETHLQFSITIMGLEKQQPLAALSMSILHAEFKINTSINVLIIGNSKLLNGQLTEETILMQRKLTSVCSWKFIFYQL